MLSGFVCETCGVSFMAPSRHRRRFCKKTCIRRGDPRELFNSHVDKSGACWLWTGSKNEHGYGCARYRDVPESLAHRVAWHIENGPVPAGLSVLHRCDTPACVNPSHLFLGSHEENMIDMAAKGRAGGHIGKTKLTPEQVREIRERAAKGETRRALARVFGVDASVVTRVVHHEAWRRVA